MQLNDATVSIVIPHFGDPKPTEALVDALRGQAHLEIIVVDDCSPVPLEAIEGARLVTRTQNGGFGTTVNAGAAVARGNLLLVLNSDLEISPTFVADLVSASAGLQPAVVSPEVTSPDGEHQWAGRSFPSVWTQAVEWLTPLARFRSTSWWHRGVGHDTRCVPGQVVNVDWVVGAAMLIPLMPFRRIGGFDEGFYMNSEEVDLQRRLRGLGVASYYVGTVTAFHEGGGSSASTERRRWIVRSRLRYANKWNGTDIPTRVVLSLATFANFAFNAARRIVGSEVNPSTTLRYELGYLWISSHGSDRPDWRAKPVI